MEKFAIIVAGGTGARFGSTIPKQFVPLCKEPMLMRTIRAFHAYDPAVTIIVALPTEYVTMWDDLCKAHSFTIPHTIVEGGANRFDSVSHALDAIHADKWLVAVHDGARPLVTRELISNGYETALRCGTAIPTIPVTDSIRQLDRTGSHTLNRDSLAAVQTPQVFDLALLKDAYNTEFSPLFTDDASVVEYRGTQVTLYKGDVNNLKVTHPIDLKTAEWLIESAHE